ncbi:MAG: signal peptidase II [Pseudomonadota bacterium]
MARLSPLFSVALIILVLDQITKVIVIHWMDLKNVIAIDVLPPYITFRMAWNEGINFGIPLGSKWVLIAIALAICIWIIIWMYREAPGRGALISAGLIVGGAGGNVIDRILYGAVADFLNMSCCGFENPWSFNVADISIFVGAVGLIFLTGGSNSKDSPRPSE